MLKKILLIVLISILASCSPKYSSNKFEAAVQKATKLMERGKLYEAKEVLKNSLVGENPKPSPFVKDSTLFFYGKDFAQTFMPMMMATTFFTKRESGELDSLKELGELKGMDKKLYDIYQKTPFNKTAIISPDIPEVYLMLGINYVNMRNFEEAKESLKKSIELFRENGIAWSELIYVIMQEKDFEKAKSTIDEALSIPFLDKFGEAAILRKLGWIQIEEGNLDEAEETFEKSIELYDHPAARSELKYIKELKKR